MITRQRTITQQFSQTKTRSPALKTKATDAPAVVETAVETVPTKRLRRTAKKETQSKVVSSNVCIEECFKKASGKTELVASTTVACVEAVSANITEPDCSDYPKFRKAEDLIKRPSLLKDCDNTPVKDTSTAAASPSISHKVEIFNEALSLPVTYQTLLNQFLAADRCLSMMGNRSETVTFGKLKSAVESATKRTFTEQMLGQILHVFPNCYKLEYGQTHYNSSNTELTIRVDCMAGLDKEDVQLSPQSNLTVALMRKREIMFRQSLLKLVFESHSDYIKSLSMGVAVQLDATKLRRWHPNFPLETATPVITAAQLPSRSNGATPRHWTAKDILERYAKNTPHLAKFMEPSQPTLDKPTSVAAPSTPNSFKVIKSGPFAGLREDLVAKVRERERRDKEFVSVADPVADLNRVRQSRLPKLIRIVRGLFFRGTKSVSLKDLLATVKYSWTSPISEEEVRATFDLLVEKFPQWIRILKVSISPEPLIQIEVDMDINELIAKLSC